jgi:hypothetical protein
MNHLVTLLQRQLFWKNTAEKPHPVPESALIEKTAGNTRHPIKNQAFNEF